MLTIGLALLTAATSSAAVPTAGQVDDTAELRGPVRWVVLSENRNVRVGNEFAALRLRGSDVVIDTRASRPVETQSLGEAAALVFAMEDGGSLAELVGHSRRAKHREAGGPTARQALLISTAAKLSSPTTAAALVVCSGSAVTVHSVKGQVFEYSSTRPEIVDVEATGDDVIVLINEGARLLALTIQAHKQADASAFQFRVHMQRTSVVEGKERHFVGAVWSEQAEHRVIAIVRDGSDSTTVGLCQVDFSAEDVAVKDVQRLPITLPRASDRLSTAYLESSHEGREYLAIGNPADDHGSGGLHIFVRENDGETWSAGTSFYPERDMRFDSSLLGTGGGTAVQLHELGSEAKVVAYVSAPFSGAFASIHCVDVESGLPLWTLPGTEYCTAGGVVGRSLEFVEMKGGWTLLKATRTRSDPSGNTHPAYDRQGVPTLMLDASTGEIIGVN